MEANIKMTGDEKSLNECMKELKKTTEKLVKTYPVKLEKQNFRIYEQKRKPIKNFKKQKG